ncbi:unnamed protein product [Meganyctiphanes norvegica]|uniref:C-type lectin domain-containing protein n=1 Tax=Meganyctiphanes norvegica TaxID=48144 RepID=A0AAV2RDH2_MEGNR
MNPLIILLFYYHMESISGSCLPEFEEVGSQCYFFSETPKSWEDAESYCKQLGVAYSKNVDLAMIDINYTENQIFLEAVKTKENAFWIGGKDREGRGDWLWNDSRQMSLSSSYWFLDEPNNGDVETCTMASYTIGANFDRVYLYSQDCDTLIPFICQEEVTCPYGFQRIGMFCYFFSGDNEVPKLTWQSARDFCVTLYEEADLAVLGLDGETDVELLEIVAAKGERVFLGASDIEEEDTWVWVDGRTLPKSLYFWDFFNPDSDGNAVYVNIFDNYKAKIADGNENLERHFVCQVN